VTNVVATILITVTTNWVAVDTLQGRKEVGVLIENRAARVVYMGKTNDYPQSSFVIGQAYVRDCAPQNTLTTHWIVNGNQIQWGQGNIVIRNE
jgi:hypothetical protein